MKKLNKAQSYAESKRHILNHDEQTQIHVNSSCLNKFPRTRGSKFQGDPDNKTKKEEKPSSQNLTLHETKPSMKANDALKQKKKNDRHWRERNQKWQNCSGKGERGLPRSGERAK